MTRKDNTGLGKVILRSAYWLQKPGRNGKTWANLLPSFNSMALWVINALSGLAGKYLLSPLACLFPFSLITCQVWGGLGFFRLVLVFFVFAIGRRGVSVLCFEQKHWPYKFRLKTVFQVSWTCSGSSRTAGPWARTSIRAHRNPAPGRNQTHNLCVNVAFENLSHQISLDNFVICILLVLKPHVVKIVELPEEYNWVNLSLFGLFSNCLIF